MNKKYFCECCQQPIYGIDHNGCNPPNRNHHHIDDECYEISPVKTGISTDDHAVISRTSRVTPIRVRIDQEYLINERQHSVMHYVGKCLKDECHLMRGCGYEDYKCTCGLVYKQQ